MHSHSWRPFVETHLEFGNKAKKTKHLRRKMMITISFLNSAMKISCKFGTNLRAQHSGVWDKRLRSTRPACAIHGDPPAWTIQWNPVQKTKEDMATKLLKNGWIVQFICGIGKQKRPQNCYWCLCSNGESKTHSGHTTKAWLTNKERRFSIAYLSLTGLSHGADEVIWD